MNSLIKKPSAWIPIAIPSTFLAFVVIGIIFFGPPVRETDEGVMAHLFQLWIVSEPFMLLFFAFKWFPKKPKETILILIIQIIFALAACFPVFYFKL